ncbi:MAG: prohead protease/major capsid protein fusion protein [Gammaproteobacteria bacterium]
MNELNLNQLLARQMSLSQNAIIDHDNRRIQVSFSSESTCLRQGMMFAKPWLETLGHNEEEVDLSRLQAGAPVLCQHDRTHPEHHIGVVEKAWLENNRGLAILKLSKRKAVDDLWQDIQDGIVHNISVGYTIKKRHLTTPETQEQPESLRVTRWQPQEISLVTVPLDPSVGIGRSQSFNPERSHNNMEQSIDHSTNILKNTITSEAESKKSSSLTNDKPTEQNNEVRQAAVMPEAKEQPPLDTQAIRTQVLQEETERRQTIHELFTPFMETQRDLCQQCLDNPNISIEAARERLLTHLGQQSLSVDGGQRISLIADERDKFRQGVENALLVRCQLADAEPDNEFQSYTLSELARRSLEKVHESTRALGSMELIGRAFTHSTSDFPAILSNTANKAMLKGYEETAETFMTWTRKGSLPDFKTATRVDISTFPSLNKIPEGTEYRHVTLGERQESIQLADYGAMFTITRQAIINDDLDAFTRIPRKMGQAALRTVGNLVYALLTDNPRMADNIPLFDAAHHNIGNPMPLSIESLNAARIAMSMQQEQKVTLNIRPSFLVVPVALEGQANVLMNSETDPEQGNSGVPNAVRGLAQVIADPRLDQVSTTTWYLTAHPSTYDVIEVAYLNGMAQPRLEQQKGWEIEGVSFKVALSAGVSALDFRTLYRGEVADAKAKRK